MVLRIRICLDQEARKRNLEYLQDYWISRENLKTGLMKASDPRFVYRDREVLRFQFPFSELSVLWNNLHLQETSLCGTDHILGHYQMVNLKFARS